MNTDVLITNEMIEEGQVKFKTGGSFYNPHMELNRTMSSLCVGTLDELNVCDGMTASGIRGLRYAKENQNVKSINFVDANRNIIPFIEQNVKLNNITNANVYCDNILTHLTQFHDYNFIELDPYGSPAPYISSAFSSFASNCSLKQPYLSVTATDTAVLHGAHHRATPKIYHAIPSKHLFMYEHGLRLLLGYIARVGHEYDYSIEPVMSFSHRHYVKVIMQVKRGAISAREQEMNDLGYIKLNTKTFEYSGIPLKQVYSSGLEKKENEILSGPIFLAELHKPKHIKHMLNLAKDRGETKAEKILELMKTEKGLMYYDLHYIARQLKSGPPKTMYIVDKLNELGFYAAPTHFTPLGVRTNAPVKELIGLF